MMFECRAVRRNIHWMTTLQIGNHLDRLEDKGFECLQQSPVSGLWLMWVFVVSGPAYCQGCFLSKDPERHNNTYYTDLLGHLVPRYRVCLHRLRVIHAHPIELHLRMIVQALLTMYASPASLTFMGVTVRSPG